MAGKTDTKKKKKEKSTEVSLLLLSRGCFVVVSPKKNGVLEFSPYNKLPLAF